MVRFFKFKILVWWLPLLFVFFCLFLWVFLGSKTYISEEIETLIFNNRAVHFIFPGDFYQKGPKGLFSYSGGSLLEPADPGKTKYFTALERRYISIDNIVYETTENWPISLLYDVGVEELKNKDEFKKSLKKYLFLAKIEQFLKKFPLNFYILFGYIFAVSIIFTRKGILLYLWWWWLNCFLLGNALFYGIINEAIINIKTLRIARYLQAFFDVLSLNGEIYLKSEDEKWMFIIIYFYIIPLFMLISFLCWLTKKIRGKE